MPSQTKIKKAIKESGKKESLCMNQTARKPKSRQFFIVKHESKPGCGHYDKTKGNCYDCLKDDGFSEKVLIVRPYDGNDRKILKSINNKKCNSFCFVNVPRNVGCREEKLLHCTGLTKDSVELIDEAELLIYSI